MITAIIIDDEAKGRIALKQKIVDYCTSVKIIAEAQNGIEGIEKIKEHNPNLIFLDIEMPSMSGFEMLNNITEKNFHVIFTTAYDQYAIKAIKYAAFDYLLKPIDIEELKIAVSKIGQLNIDNVVIQAKVLEHNNSNPQKKLSKIAISTVDGLSFYDIDDIVHLQAKGNYTYIYFKNLQKIITSKTLKDFEDLLPNNIFFRTHQSQLINLNYIKKYRKANG